VPDVARTCAPGIFRPHPIIRAFDMSKLRDPVVVAALEYERATLRALRALSGTDGEAQRAACLRFADAVAAIEGMPAQDHQRSLTYLTRRGRIPDHAWRLIAAALEAFATGGEPGSPDQSPLQ
jgi:hypothetical protein